MLSKNFLTLILLLSINTASAQEPVIFSVKKSISKIIISPNSDTLWGNYENVICVSSENNDYFFNIEVPDAIITRENGCFKIYIICNLDLETTRRNGNNIDYSDCPAETILSVYKYLENDKQELIFIKKYKLIPVFN